MGGKKQGQFACDFALGKGSFFCGLLSPRCDYLNLCYSL